MSTVMNHNERDKFTLSRTCRPSSTLFVTRHSSVQLGILTLAFLFTQRCNYGVSKAELVISVTMVNYVKRQDSGKSTGFHYCLLLVADADSEVVYKQRLS